MNTPQTIPTYNIASMAGDGAGPEVMRPTHAVIERIGQLYNIRFELTKALAGGAAYEETGEFFPEETKRICEASDAMLLAAIGGPVEGPEAQLPKWKGCEGKFLLAIRKYFNLPDNIRPVEVLPELAHLSKLKDDVVAGTDIETHRELVSGIYFGPRGSGGSKERGDRWGSNTMHYTEGDVRAIMIPALQAAAERRGILHVVDKNNVLQEVGKIWRDVAKEEAEKFPGVELKPQTV
jgi:3-isopropylmalate dehydrogenase